MSFLSDSQEEITNDQLPTKESNPGHFTLPCTISNFNFYAMADLGVSVNVIPRNIFEYLELTNLSETEMLVEMADMRKKAPLGINNETLSLGRKNGSRFRKMIIEEMEEVPRNDGEDSDNET
ncbi:zinc knuckle CX2CX4HX4C containing protein [Tanacetum coccineum]